MTSAPIPAPAPAPGQPGPFNTPQILKGSRIAIIALNFLLLISIIEGTHVHRNAMTTVGKDTAPSIIAAQQIKAALAGMDADAAEELLQPSNYASDATDGYDLHIQEASRALLAAAGNITYEAEREPIGTLELVIPTYERLIQEAQDLHDAGSPDDIRYYRGASLLMDGTLLPAADALDQANNVELEKTYKDEAFRSGLARTFIALAALLTLLALVQTQRLLSRRMRRTVNPMLFLATILTLGIALYSFIEMGNEEHQLKIAKEDSFASLHALYQARAVGYEAGSDQSRFLLEPDHQDEAQRSFMSASDALAWIPSGTTPDRVVAAERRGEHVDRFTGLLADELNNITFPGERDAAADALENYEHYYDIDSEIRALERLHRHQEAVTLSIGSSKGHSDWAFTEFNNALTRTLDINQQHFDQSVSEGLAAVDGLDTKASVIAALVAVLAFMGLAPRIREYQ